jgi:phosphate starvation-inducible PhoH-like protein
MYILYIALIGLWVIDGVNGLFGYRQSVDRITYRDLQMRAKRSKAIDDSYGSGAGQENIVASLAAGGGGSANCRSISPVYTPRTANQKTYVKYLGEPDTKIVLGVGAAGSGKTLFACYSAIQELRRGSISKIIMTRPVVPVEEEEIGFLPGSLINKMDPWTRPIFDILLEFYAQKDIDAMLHGGVIEISPLAFMRGRTFKRAFIIADEMQNSSPNQMLMLTTRLGEGSKMVITGDLKQSDRGVDNGLADLLRKLKTYNEKEGGVDRSSNKTAIKYVELESADVQRSAIVSKILDIYGGSTPAKSELVTNAVKELGLAAEKPLATKKTIVENKMVEIGNNDAALMPIHHVSKYIRKQ